MTHGFELDHALALAASLARRTGPRSALAAALAQWYHEQAIDPDWSLPGDMTRGLDPAIWDDLRARLGARSERGAKTDARSSTIAAFAAHLCLDPEETAIFALAIRAARGGPLRALASALADAGRLSGEDVITHLTGLASDRVRQALRSGGALRVAGLIQIEAPPTRGLGLLVSYRLLTALEQPAAGLAEILANFFAPLAPVQVPWEGFDHLDPLRDLTLRLLSGALERREPGVNILLHGVPGTGKTEFCKAVAARLGVALRAVGETDEEGEEPSRHERLQQLRLGQRLVQAEGRGLILFDEMEDLFSGLDAACFGPAMPRTGSKVHLNRLLETNPVPTLWTANIIADCDPAVLRRFSLVLGLRVPPAAVRARMWRDLAAKRGLGLADPVVEDLAHAMPLAPALADSALRVAHLAGGGLADVRLAAQTNARALQIGPGWRARGGYDPGLIQADQDVRRILARATRDEATGLCLSGASGCGKSAFARHLAEKLDMPLHEVDGASLVTRVVGGDERAIARAFAAAEEAGALLVLDGAETLLGGRHRMSSPWEIAVLSQMIDAIEHHALPFVCTVQATQGLDSAALGRFTLTIGFEPLDAGRRLAAYRRLFGAEPWSARDLPEGLTIGDMVSVARRLSFLGVKDPRAILTALTQVPLQGQGAPMGFRPFAA